MDKKAKKKNLSDQIADILKERITSGYYSEDQKLPGEIELAEMFGVSRMTARNVYQKLSVIGLVEIKNGDGTYVKKFDFNEYFSNAAKMINNPSTTEDIGEFRKFFEPFCIELACQKRTEHDIEMLKNLYEKLLDAAESPNVNDYYKADYRFHHYIAEITGNAIIVMLYEMLNIVIEKHFEETLIKYAKINNYSFNPKDENYAARKNALLHKEILDDIISGNNSVSKNTWLSLNKLYDITEI